MKRFLWSVVSVFLWSSAWSQLSIDITINDKAIIIVRQKNKVVGEKDAVNLNSDSNKIRIINSLAGVSPTIILRPKVRRDLQFVFGEGGVALAKGTTNWTFNKAGKIAGHPDKGTLIFPLEIIVARNQAPLGSRMVGDTSGDPAQPTTPDRADPNDRTRLTKLPFYDAWLLANYVTTLSRKEYKEILNHYRFKEDVIDDEIKLRDDYAGNKFLAEEITKAFADPRWNPTEQRSGIPLNLDGLDLSAIGGMDVTGIADGLAKFLVKRTKEELTVTFFDRFKMEMMKPEYADLHSLFPQTYQALNVIGDEIYQYQAYIQTLRECFEKDLRNLPLNFPNVIENHPEYFKERKDLKALLLTASYISTELQNETHPGDILKNYPAGTLNDLNKNWKGSVQSLQLISVCLRDSVKDQYWVTQTQLLQMVNNERIFRIFLGLMYQLAKEKYGKVEFETTNLVRVMDSVDFKKDYEDYRTYLVNISGRTNDLNRLIKNHLTPKNDSAAIELRYQYYRATAGLISSAARVKDLPHIELPDLPKQLKDGMDVINGSAEIVVDVNRRNYAAAVTQAAQIYFILFDKSAEKGVAGPVPAPAKDSSKKIEVKANAKSKETTVSDSSTKSIAADNAEPDASNVKDQIFKYGTFMATIVEAESSDDVQDAIEAFALPSGSARVKRETEFNVSLNAYTGLFGGWEMVKGIDTKASFNSFGVTAPVGVAISRGHSVLFFFGTGKHAWSSTLFFSLIDVGALASFRFQNPEGTLKDTTQVSSSPVVSFKDIVSPGVFYSLGIPKTPLSINVGYQVGPNLRTVYGVDPNGNKTEIAGYADTSYGRLSFSICVDIPIVNFYTNSGNGGKK